MAGHEKKKEDKIGLKDSNKLFFIPLLTMIMYLG